MQSGTGASHVVLKSFTPGTKGESLTSKIHTHATKPQHGRDNTIKKAVKRVVTQSMEQHTLEVHVEILS